MKIGIDGRFYQESGVGRYLRNLISCLRSLDKHSLRSDDLKKNEYFIFLLPKDYQEFKTSQNFQKVLADFSWYGFAEQFKFPKLLNQFKLSLVHFPHFNVPIFYSGKFVVTIHDLIHQHHRMSRATTLDPLTYKVKQFGYRKVFKTAIQKSSKILVPSNFVKKGLIDEWNIDSKKIAVTYEAVDDKMLKLAGDQKILKRSNITKPYIFYVGNAHPHKNVEGLIKVFLSLHKRYRNLTLVLSGHDHYFWQRIKQSLAASPLKKDIIFTGSITDEQLVALYKNAKCFVMPSLEEGFGIPLLEAMALGCPVVSSNAGALTEVGGEAAIYFDPKNLTDMEKKIDQILKDNAFTNQLIKMGQNRIKLFSWEKLARQTLEVYENSNSP